MSSAGKVGQMGKDGKLFTCHKFMTMTVKHNGSSVSVAGDNRITPLGAKLRHYSFWKDIEMIFATVLGRKVWFGGEEI